MTTWTLQISRPRTDGGNNSGQQAFVDSGIRIDDTVQGLTGIAGSVLDGIQGSTTAIKIGKYMASLQSRDKGALAWQAFDGASTIIKPII